MSESHVILRKWSSRIRTKDRQAYVDYVFATGAKDYATTPGNLGYHILTRDLGDGTTEITTLSWWASMDDVRQFAGSDPEIARYYPEDEQFLLDRPLKAEHHLIEAGHAEVDVGRPVTR